VGLKYAKNALPAGVLTTLPHPLVGWGMPTPWRFRRFDSGTFGGRRSASVASQCKILASGYAPAIDITISGCSKMLNMITLSTLPVPEIDLSMTLKVIEKLW